GDLLLDLVGHDIERLAKRSDLCDIFGLDPGAEVAVCDLFRSGHKVKDRRSKESCANYTREQRKTRECKADHPGLNTHLGHRCQCVSFILHSKNTERRTPTERYCRIRADHVMALAFMVHAEWN